MFQLQFMIEKWTSDIFTLPTIFYDISVSCNRFSKTEMRQFGASGTDVLSDKGDSCVHKFQLEVFDLLLGSLKYFWPEIKATRYAIIILQKIV